MEIRYGAWTTTEAKGKRLLCRCDCGTTRYVIARDLRTGKSKGCGCTGMAAMRKAQKEAFTTHGMTRSTEFQIWTDMKRRCHDPRRPDYHRYGGRGITVCHEWRESFEIFYRDMGPRPAGHTLDRMHNDQGYNKQNCVWATKKKQARNTRTNRIVEVDGARMTLIDAAEKYGIPYQALLNRIGALGWPLDKALRTPVRGPGEGRARLPDGRYGPGRTAWHGEAASFLRDVLHGTSNGCREVWVRRHGNTGRPPVRNDF